MPDIYVAWVGVGVEVWVGAIHRRFKLQFYKHAGLEGCRPVTLMAHPRRFSLTPRTLMGCTVSPLPRVGAPHQCPFVFGSKLPHLFILIYAVAHFDDS